MTLIINSQFNTFIHPNAYDKNKQAILLNTIANTYKTITSKESLSVKIPKEKANIIEFIKDQKICNTMILNYESQEYQNTPLTLALMKGYDHKGGIKMSEIIDTILDREDIDVNKSCVLLGLTPIEIAIMRRDNDVARALVTKRAIIPNHQRIKALLSMSYSEVIEILAKACGTFPDNIKDGNYHSDGIFYRIFKIQKSKNGNYDNHFEQLGTLKIEKFNNSNLDCVNFDFI